MIRSCAKDGLRKTLYEEHLSRPKQADEHIPYRHGDFFYYTRNVEGLPHRVRLFAGLALHSLVYSFLSETKPLSRPCLLSTKIHCRKRVTFLATRHKPGPFALEQVRKSSLSARV